MKKDIINIGGSLLLLIFSIVSVIFIFANVPKDLKPKNKPLKEDYTIWYDYSNGAWRTRSHDPYTGAKGEVITLEELETLKLQK